MITPDDEDFYMRRIREDSSFNGALAHSITTVVYINQRSDKNFRNLICKEVILTVPVVIYAQKDFFLLDELNEKILILSAAGLINFWHLKDVDEDLLNVKDSKQPTPLTLHQLSGCFYLLLFGFAVAAIFFGFELLKEVYESFLILSLPIL